MLEEPSVKGTILFLIVSIVLSIFWPVGYICCMIRGMFMSGWIVSDNHQLFFSKWSNKHASQP